MINSDPNPVTTSDPSLDMVFAALADPTRRAIVERLLNRGEASAGELAAPFAISAPAISRHLKVLEEAGLIERRTDRQFRLIRARREGFRTVETWIEEQGRHWALAVDRLEAAISRDLPGARKS